MKESGITSRLVKVIPSVMPGAIVFKHFDVSTDGIPDLSVTWGRKTLWAEIKYMNGLTREVQVVTMKRLAQMGRAWYVRFTVDTEDQKIILIYSPLAPDAPYSRLGWDAVWVAEFFRKELEAA